VLQFTQYLEKRNGLKDRHTSQQSTLHRILLGDKMGAACSTHGAHKYLRNVGCKASRPNKTPGHGCEDNIKINLTETV
jgi:hypothetical protein